MFVLDTDTLTHLYAGHPRVIEQLRRANDPEIGITIITKIEILRGRHEFLLKASNGDELLRAYHWLTRSEELLEQILILPIDAESASVFDQLRTQQSLRKIGRADLLIASIAIAQRATLVTRNLRHFRVIPGLHLTNWVD